MANAKEKPGSHDSREHVGPHSAEEKIRRLEENNALLRGRIRGFATLSDMYKDSKQKNRLMEKQNSLLIQILSVLTNAKTTESDEASIHPEDLDTIMTLDERPAEESLRILTQITSKLTNNNNNHKEGRKTENTTPKDMSRGNEESSIQNTKQHEVMEEDKTTKHSLQETERYDPPGYQLLNESESRNDTDSRTTHSSASFSIIDRKSEASQKYQDAFDEFKQKVSEPQLSVPEKVRSICDLFELVLRGGNANVVEELSQCFEEVLRAVVELEEENQSLKDAKEEAIENLKRLERREDPFPMGLSQSQLNDSSWVDVNTTENRQIEELRRETDRKEHVITKLKGHVDELTKANVAWEKQYDSIKKEYTTKLLKLKSALKEKEGKRFEATETNEFVLVGPDEMLVQEERAKIHNLEQKLEAKESAIEKLKTENKALRKMKDISPMQREEESELNLLRQQIRIFKDDFATERSEHKKLWKKHQKLIADHQDVKKKVQDVSSRLARTQKQLTTEKREKELLQMSLLKSHCVHSCHHGDPTYPDRVVRPDVSTTAIPDNDKWACPACTFMNVPERIACEICGKKCPNRSPIPETIAPGLVSRAIKKT
jgi:hypothetical protein